MDGEVLAKYKRVIDGHLLTDKPEEWRVEARGGFKVPRDGILERHF
jgi:hypothetical protein